MAWMHPKCTFYLMIDKMRCGSWRNGIFKRNGNFEIEYKHSRFCNWTEMKTNQRRTINHQTPLRLDSCQPLENHLKMLIPFYPHSCWSEVSYCRCRSWDNSGCCYNFWLVKESQLAFGTRFGSDYKSFFFSCEFEVWTTKRKHNGIPYTNFFTNV